MKRHLNLMSNRARMHTCIRTRVRQWSTVLTVELVLLLPMTLVVWWPVYKEGQEVKTVEAQYEPIRQMREAGRTFEKRIELIRTQEKTALSLAQMDTPIVTFMGLVGRAVAESNGQVFVEDVNFNQESAILTDATSERFATVDIGGKGFNEEAVNQLSVSLQSALPFATVQLKLSKVETINEYQMQRFIIECSL